MSFLSDEPSKMKEVTAKAIQQLSERIEKIVEKMNSHDISEEDDSTGHLQPDMEKAQEELVTLQNILKKLIMNQSEI